MPSDLKFYYSSGQEGTNAFNFQPSESIGGVITGAEIQSGELQNLFGKISSNMLSEGYKEYRCVYIKNSGDVATTDLAMALIYPITTATLNPEDLVPSPSDGDRYIVPSGALGAWASQDGKVAIYSSADGGTWSFKRLLCTYKFGFLVPADVTLDETLITKGLVPKIPNITVKPNGVSFVDKNQEEIGDADSLGVEIQSSENLAMWIERTVIPQDFSKDDFDSDANFFSHWEQTENFDIVFSSDT